MADDFIDRLRNASFPTTRKGGYDPDAVDAYLRELADWLETGGSDETRASLIRREMERIGERTGGILAATQASADEMAKEAKAEAEEMRESARRDASEARSSADEYALETRRAADEHVRISAEAAAREASDLRTKAEAEAQEKIGKADALLQEAEAKAKARTAGVEQEIADLVKTRASIVENLESLTTGIRGVVDGPGGEQLEVPEGLQSAIEEAESGVHEVPEPSIAEAVAPSEPTIEPSEPTVPFVPEGVEDDDESGESEPFDPVAVQEHPIAPPARDRSDDTTAPVDDGSEDETVPVEEEDETPRRHRRHRRLRSTPSLSPSRPTTTRRA